MSNTWTEYVRRIAGATTQADIAIRAGVAASNVGRWQRGEPGSPRGENVAAFARAFGRPVIEAFAAAGFCTEAETEFPARTPLSEYAYAELVHELMRRDPTA